MGERCSAVVIGGGLSGLAAARRLALDGVDVVVLEARGEPGGKCVRRVVAGHAVDAGAAWTAPSQHALQELAAEYGVRTYKTELAGGRTVQLVGGVAQHRAPDDWGVDGRALEEAERAFGELEALAATVPAARPWEAPDAERLDAMTVESWIGSVTTEPDARALLEGYFTTTTASPRRLSLLSVLAFIASAGGVEGLETEAEELLEGGASAIVDRLADELGERLRLDWPVTEIAWSAGEVVLTGPRGTVAAQRAILAMSPADARRMQFRPGLPTKRRLLHKGWVTGGAIKATLVYERPFWQQPEDERPPFTGWGTNDAGCPSVVLDATAADRSVGVLVAFTELMGEHEPRAIPHEILEDPAARGALLIENLVRMFGPAAAAPLGVCELHWGEEPYIDGCLGFGAPGLLTQCGEALREPIGPLHWAGAETADEWANHLSGAVQAGERAAREVAAAL